MIFKNQKLESGDFVAFKTKSVPISEVRAAVVAVEDGVLAVISTMLKPFQHNGNFTEEEVEQIVVVYPAEVAIPQESRGKGFYKNQRVSAIVRGKEHEGKILAAFDGIVVARESGQLIIVGKASSFNAI